MDDTGFVQKQNLRKVVVSKGSRNMWSKCDNANFHMTFVVCVSAAKYVVPPLLVIHGKRLNKDFLGGWDIEGVSITTAPNVFINYNFFKAGLNSLQTLFLIQLRAHLSWFMMAVPEITMMKL